MELLSLQIFTSLCVTLLATVVGSSMHGFYCTEYTNVYVNLTKYGTSSIRTLKKGETNYGDNLYCSWTISAGIGNRVQVSVKEFDIGSVPDGEDCYKHTYVAYKQVQIMDSFNWLNADAGIFYRMCDNKNPKEFTSKYFDLHIEFHSKQNSGNHKGIEFVARSFKKGTCPPGWVENTEYCYKIMNNIVSWIQAQEICTIQQGNLVSFENDAEANFVTTMAKNYSMENSSVISPWSIGLNNMYEGAYLWIDEINSTFNYQHKLQGNGMTDGTKHCTVITPDGLLDKIYCTSVNYPFICKAQKDGLSKLYKVNNDDVNPSSGFSKEAMPFIIFITLTFAKFASVF